MAGRWCRSSLLGMTWVARGGHVRADGPGQRSFPWSGPRASASPRGVEWWHWSVPCRRTGRTTVRRRWSPEPRSGQPRGRRGAAAEKIGSFCPRTTVVSASTTETPVSTGSAGGSRGTGLSDARTHRSSEAPHVHAPRVFGGVIRMDPDGAEPSGGWPGWTAVARFKGSSGRRCRFEQACCGRVDHGPSVGDHHGGLDLVGEVVRSVSKRSTPVRGTAADPCRYGCGTAWDRWLSAATTFR